MLLFLFLIQGLCEKLIQTQILWRHGARTPLHCNWNCMEFKQKEMLKGYLTPTGMRQHYILGQWLRKRYIEDLKLLDETYNESQIYAESSDVNRTIMSAMSNLQGMYPPGTGPFIDENLNHTYLLPPNVDEFEEIGKAAIPGQIQLVPIHVRDKSLDNIIRGYDPQSCPRNAEFIASNLNSLDYIKINTKAQPLILDFADQVGLDPRNLNITNLYEYQDTLDSCQFNGYPQPNIKSSTFEQMKQIEMLYFNLEHFATFEQVRLQATPFLKRVLDNMDNIKNNKTSHKYRIFSGHDTTVLLILNALNLTSMECLKQVYFNEPVDNHNCIYTYPGYASNIIFELYESELGEYSVQVLYNGTVMPICDNKKRCRLEEFNNIIQYQNVKNYDEECYITKSTETRLATWLIVGISVVSTLLVLFSGCSIFLLVRKRRLDKYTKAANQFEV